VDSISDIEVRLYLINSISSDVFRFLLIRASEAKVIKILWFGIPFSFVSHLLPGRESVGWILLLVFTHSLLQVVPYSLH
jgi:hypothetical protein